MPLQIVKRKFSSAISQQLINEGINPLLARLCAARGINFARELDYRLAALLPFTRLKNAERMACRLADAIANQQKIVIVADYDADGATACAVALSGLAKMGALIDFIVPNRFDYGYGLTPAIVELALKKQPDILLTVDNGIGSISGVKHAQQLGIEVLITDHHLAGDSLPDALIVNPNQPECSFPSKALAGVGVIFYVLMALRAELRERKIFAQTPEPNLAELLDLVALGTVADVVTLDQNNRILVEQGLRRIRAGRLRCGLQALFNAAGREASKATTFDLAFALAPRLNAAGRMSDMQIGINCLMAEHEDVALTLASELEQFNQKRRSVESSMQAVALDNLDVAEVESNYTLSLYRDNWHQGVVGILASRLKERFHRPCIIFAQADNGELRGSGRSIRGFHLRDALDLISKRHPELISRFGGHAMAAGLTIAEPAFEQFSVAFEKVARELLEQSALKQQIETDGSLSSQEINLPSAELIAAQIWGQGFAAPSFNDRFRVISQRIVGTKHLKLILEKDGIEFNAMLFNQAKHLPNIIDAVYQLIANEWRGNKELQLYIDYWCPVN